MWLRHHFQGQKVKGQLVADVLNIQHAGTRATWRINTKILLCRNSTATWWINAKILSTCTEPGIILCRHAHSLLQWTMFRVLTNYNHTDIQISKCPPTAGMKAQRRLCYQSVSTLILLVGDSNDIRPDQPCTQQSTRSGRSSGVDLSKNKGGRGQSGQAIKLFQAAR